MLKQEPQHHRDEQEVDKVLATVAAQDRDLAREIPRPVKDLIALGTYGSGVIVDIVPAEGLHAGVIVRELRDRYKACDTTLPDDSTLRFAGYICSLSDGSRRMVTIFYDQQYNEPAQRFTLAHEAGHLFLQVMADVRAERQGDLFGAPRAQGFWAARDPIDHVRRGLDVRPEDHPALVAEYKRRNRGPKGLDEIKADGFAAELLAPFREVQKIFRENPGREREEYVELVRARFHVSRTMARVRLAELVEEPDPDQAIMELVR